MSRATVIIPTFGNATFARWAIKSVQDQTVKDIEICIICDGSPRHMISFFEKMKNDDPRIEIFVFPKSPRTGEPYRDIVISHTTGKIICYCSHDDLWLPKHVKIMEKALKNCCFTHTLHTFVNPHALSEDMSDWLGGIYWINLDQKIVERMQSGENFFGLTFGAHARECYYKLPEGWVTTPDKNTPTDLHMWCKFLANFGENCKTTVKISALCFPQIPRKEWTEQQRYSELKFYYNKIQTMPFRRKIFQESLKFCPDLIH